MASSGTSNQSGRSDSSVPASCSAFSSRNRSSNSACAGTPGGSRPAEAIYLTDRTDLDVLTIGPSLDSPEVYFWWKFCNPPLDRGPADLPRPYDDLMVAVQISPRRYVGDVAAYLFLDNHVKALPFAQTWGGASTNLHYPFK